jgi:cytidylate kinase
MIGTSDRMVATLARLSHYVDEHRSSKKASTTTPLTVAVKRQAGSGGAEIARAAGAKLGWPVYDHELLQRISEEKGLRARLVEQLDERRMNWLEAIVLAYSSGGGKEGAYLHALLELFGSLGKIGHCIIVGRGAAHALPPETTLRVRILADHSVRIANVQKTQGLSADEARRWVNTADHERKKFVRYYFQADVTDPMLCDLVLRSDRLGVEECATIIAHAAQAMDAAISA